MKNGKITKVLAILLATIMVLSVAPLSGLGQVFTTRVSAEQYGPYTYSVVDGNATITKVDKDNISGVVEIPDNLGGYPVTEIGYQAFWFCENITEITIPDSVTTIGIFAFNNCSSLTSIAGLNCVTTIGDSAFNGCEALTEIIIPDSVTTIGKGAFNGCVALTEISIPKSVTNMGDAPFSGCKGITKFTVAEENPNFCAVEGVLFNKDKTQLIHYPAGDARTSYDIPSTVTLIGSDAFSYCDKLTSITIPNGVTEIGDFAFYFCTAVTNMVIPKGITNISFGMFSFCNALTSVTLPHTLTAVGDCAFFLCNSLTDVYYAGTQEEWNNIDIIGENHQNLIDATKHYGQGLVSGLYTYKIVDGNATITDVDNSIAGDIQIPDNFGGYPVTALGFNSFAYSNKITGVIIPKGVINIQAFVFRDCSDLTWITIPDTMEIIGKNAFLDSGLTDIYYCCTETQWNENNVQVVDPNTEYNNATKHFGEGLVFGPYTYKIVDGNAIITDVDNLIMGVVEIPDNFGGYPVTEIGNNAFLSCNNITKVTIPDSVAKIGDGAFKECKMITKVTIPDSVTKIGDGAFKECKKITEINIPDSVTAIGNQAFYYCENITEINIPDSLTTIGNGTFSFCKKITEINIPHGVTSIGDRAFRECSALESIYIPDTVTTIGNEAFYFCVKITEINIPGGVTSIGNFAFSNCSALESIYIPESVLTIGDGAFAYCYSLKTFTVNENNPNFTVYDGVLFSKDKTRLVAFPASDTRESYKIPSFVTAIGDYAFGDCGNLQNIDIPNSVTEIGENAFDNCNKITSTVFPRGITKIDDWTCYSCVGLVSVTIPKSVASIGEGAFDICLNITDVYYTGTQEEWNALVPNINVKNQIILDATKHYSHVVEYKEGIFTYTLDDEDNATLTDIDSVPFHFVIPDNLAGYPVTGIGEGIFDNVFILSSLTIPKSVVYIGNGVFEALPEDVPIYYLGTKSDWDKVDNEDEENLNRENLFFTYETQDYKLFYTVDDNGNATIGDTDNSISGDITLPGTIDGIPVTGIGIGAFSACPSLTGIIIPEGVTFIGNEAFYNSSELAFITIPHSVTTIGEYAFNGCTALTAVYYEGEQADWNKINGNEELAGIALHCTINYSDAKLPEITSKTAKYKNNLTVKITARGILANGFLVVDGKKIAPDANGTATFETQYQATATRSFKAHIEDKDGNIKVAQKEYKVEVNTGFFAKLSAFFTDFLFNGFKWKNASVEF